MPSSFAKSTKTNEQKKVRFVVPPEVPNTDVHESDVDEKFERDELHRALKSALETQVLVCADEWLSVFSDYVGRLGNEQEAEHKKLEHDVKRDVAEETMSAMVKLAKDPLEPHDIDQPTAECQLMTLCERRLATQRDDLRPVQGGEEDTDQRVMTLHTEMCEKSEVTSVEEGHDVDGRHAPQSDETAGILKQLKFEMSADMTAFKMKGLDRKTNHQGLMKAETEEVAQRLPLLRDKLRIEVSLWMRVRRTLTETKDPMRSLTEVSQCCGSQPQGYKPRKGDEIYAPFL